jgi:hypothetical protein
VPALMTGEAEKKSHLKNCPKSAMFCQFGNEIFRSFHVVIIIEIFPQEMDSLINWKKIVVQDAKAYYQRSQDWIIKREFMLICCRMDRL